MTATKRVQALLDRLIESSLVDERAVQLAIEDVLPAGELPAWKSAMPSTAALASVLVDGDDFSE